MGSIWTVTPSTVKYDLSFDGTPFSIEVKQELNTGEYKRLFAAGFRTWRRGTDVVPTPTGNTKEAAEQFAASMELHVRPEEVVFEKVITWLKGWSLADSDGQPLPLVVDTLRALHPSVFNLIENQIDLHQEMQEKKVKADSHSKTASGETSATPVSVKTS